MPIPDYKTEKDFRQQWIAPFLSKMGFILPKHVHGSDEQGKDFFFFDHDRFGNVRLYAVQAKLGNVGTGSELTALLDQIDRIFEVRLKYHQGAHDQRIAAAYLMTTGHFSPEAKERIYDRCLQRSFGENVICMDGETLDNLERHATYQRDADRRGKLLGLMSEAQSNMVACDSLIKSSEQGNPEFPRFRTIALAEVLKSPPPRFNYQTLSESWRLCVEFDSRANSKTGPIQVVFGADVIQSFIKAGRALQHFMAAIAVYCHTSITELDAQYNLSIEVLLPQK